MLGASLRHRGIELLRRVDDLAAAAAKGSTAGIPLLHPWANRLARSRYAAAGREVALDPASPLLHFDEHGQPIHGVPWSRLVWTVTDASADHVTACLEWTRADLLAVFPFPHRLEMTATLDAKGLTVATTLHAAAQGPVPVSFGFHPYVGIADLPRREWRLTLPAMHRLQLDSHAIPDGRSEPFGPFDAPLGDLAFDDGFALHGERASFALSGGGMRLGIEFLTGYPYAQIYSPTGSNFVAIEPMTAPTSALTHGRGLAIVPPGGRFHAAFRIDVQG